MKMLNLVKFFVESLKSSLHPIAADFIYLPSLVSGSLHPTNHNTRSKLCWAGG